MGASRDTGTHKAMAGILPMGQASAHSKSRLCPYPDNFATTGRALFIFLIGRDVSSFRKTGPYSFLANEHPLERNSCGRQANYSDKDTTVGSNGCLR